MIKNSISTSNTLNEFDFKPTDIICQWLYSKPKYDKQGNTNPNRRRVGYLVATKIDGIIYVGWSKCSPYDEFNETLARKIAFGRLTSKSTLYVPKNFKHVIPEFLLRCMKYFQTNKVQEIYLN